jgi:4'-phosphopantetheinyl transferase
LNLSINIGQAELRIESPRNLEPNEVHLWRLNLQTGARGVEKWQSILSADERSRAARYHREIDRQYFIAARATLRQILGSYLKADPAVLTFAYSEKEKPFLGGAEAARGIEFNISHSGSIALLAFARQREIGVDVEQIRRDFDTARIAERFFSAAEQKQLAALPEEQRSEAFFFCWTRKEAYIKATGKGLSLPLHQFDVSLAPKEQNALLACRPDPYERAKWVMRDVAVPEGYAAAICVSGTGWTLVDGVVSESPE